MQNNIYYKNTKISFSSIGKGTAIVLLHGFLENSTMWNSVAKELSKQNKVICIDLLGHGNTECMGYIDSVGLMAEAVKAVLQHLRIRKSILIGHSMGGYVALAFAEKNPLKVTGLCLMNSTSLADDNERKTLRTRANKLVQKHFKNMVQMSFTNLFSEESRNTYKHELKIALKEAVQTTLRGYIACQEGMKIRPNREPVLQELPCKKLLILGKKDTVLDYENIIQEYKNNQLTKDIFNEDHMNYAFHRIYLIF